jgi:hypothetical protein
MRLALAQGLAPRRYAAGAAAALRLLQQGDARPADQLLRDIWQDARPAAAEQQRVIDLIRSATGPD